MFDVSQRQVVLEVKNPLASAGHLRHSGSIPGWEEIPEREDGNQLQYSHLESQDRGAWQATYSHLTLQSQTQLKRLSPQVSKGSSLMSNMITFY